MFLAVSFVVAKKKKKKETNLALGMGQGGCPGRDIKNIPKEKKLKELTN